MASPWALDRFGGLTGAISKRLPQAVGAALERTFARRTATTDPPPDEAPIRRRRALRHSVLFSGASNQSLLDSRWGEPTVTDDDY
jgi:hypothetical protein